MLPWEKDTDNAGQKKRKFEADIHVKKKLNTLVMRMHLPIIRFKVTDKTTNLYKKEKNKNYFLFQDVLTAITHISTEKNIREEDLYLISLLLFNSLLAHSPFITPILPSEGLRRD